MKTANQVEQETEIVNLPEEVVDSDWRDDISEDLVEKSRMRKIGKVSNDNVLSFELVGGNEKGEEKYESPEEISASTERMIRLRNARNAKRGKKIESLLSAA